MFVAPKTEGSFDASKAALWWSAALWLQKSRLLKRKRNDKTSAMVKGSEAEWVCLHHRVLECPHAGLPCPESFVVPFGVALKP